MEQVKIFRYSFKVSGYSTNQLQIDVNNFLKDNKDKYITHIKQSESEHYITLCIFYEDVIDKSICLPTISTEELINN